MQSYRGIYYRTLRGPHTEADISRGALLWHAVYEVNGKGHFILNRRSQKDLMLKLEQAIDKELLPKPRRPLSKRGRLIEKIRRMTVANGCTAAEAAAATRKLHRFRAGEAKT